jgi:hypothetical protein
MDLKTALEQRNNYVKFMQVLDQKVAYAQDTLSTSEYEHKLRNTILRDLHRLSMQKVQAEAKATLLNSRIEFIQMNRKPDE